MRPSTDEPIRIYRYSSGGWEFQETGVIEEASVSLTVNGEMWLSFTCTPTHLEELCVGFLFNEGIIQDIGEVEIVSVNANQTNVDIWLDRAVEKPTQWRRTSGCTGGISMVEPDAEIKKLPAGNIKEKIVADGMRLLLKAQALYRKTKGVHCSALYDGECIYYVAEDIGRHNTLDKLAGMYLLSKKSLQSVMVLTTGRVSSEMLQKSAKLGAIAVISRTSPTTLSIQMAKKLGVTLIGYARGDQFMVYAHPERLAEYPASKTGEDLSQPDKPSSNNSA